MASAPADRTNVGQVVEVLRAMTRDLETAKDFLTELDSAIGDGDLGITISRGFQAVRSGLQDHPQDVGRILIKAGMNFSNAAGATMGALLSTAFMRAGKEVQGQMEVTLADIARMIKAAEQGVREMGKAKPGDKTMLDAIVPAGVALELAVQKRASLLEGLQQALAAAEQGMYSTIEMKSAFGRARWLGERTIGHQDPGATVVFLIFKSLVESTRQVLEVLEPPEGLRRMAHKLVFRVKDVPGFSPRGADNSYVSKLLVDKETVGSNYLTVNYFVLKPGKSTESGHHPDPYDEFYYVLRGRARLRLGDPPEVFELEPDTVAFIPSGTAHSLENTGMQDLELITVMPHQLVEGVNSIYDERRRTWGSSRGPANQR